MEKFKEENEFYVETKVFENAKQILKQRNCVILIGKEGIGKTAMAVHLMFEYAKNEEFVVRRIRTSHEFYNTVDLQMKNLIFFDNIFKHCERTLSLWKMFDFMQESVSPCIIEKSKLYIIIASRPREFDDAVRKMNYNHSLLQNCAIDFELNGVELNEREKKSILQRKMEFARSFHKIEEENFSDAQWESILKSSTPFGFPLCAHLFACDRACRNIGTTFFSNPQNYMLFRVKTIIQADKSRRTEVLLVLMLVYEIRNEPFYFKESKKYLEVLHELHIAEKLHLDEDQVVKIEETVFDHNETYVKKSKESTLQFIHPSVQEAVQNYFFETYIENAIDMFPLSVLFQKMHRKYFLQLEPVFQDLFIRRLETEIEAGNFCKVCEFEELKDREVSKKLLLHFMTNTSDFKNLLNTKNNRGSLPFIYWFTMAACNKTILDLLSHKPLSKVCSNEELYEHHFFSLLASCALPEKSKLVEYILTKYSKDDIQNHYDYILESDSLTENPIKMCFSPLLVAVQNSNYKAILLLTKHKATYPRSNWRGWTFLHACSKYNEKQICSSEFLRKVLEFEEKNCSNEKDKYADIISDKQTTVFEKIVIEVDKSIEKHGSHKNILLCLVDIHELEITDAFIKAFCSLIDANESSHLHPLNFVDKNGNSVLHLLLKCHRHDTEMFRKYSEDRGVLSKSDTENVDSDYMYESCTLVEEANVLEEEINRSMSEKKEDKSEKIRTLQRLLAIKGLDTNIKNANGETALLIEASKLMPSIDVIKILLKYGGNSNEQDLFRQNCLHKIILQNCPNSTEVCNVLALFVQHGADVNQQDIHGNSPIFVEINKRRPRTKVIRFLIDAKINMNLLDGKGRTVLNVALLNPEYEDMIKIKIIEILLSSKNINVLSQDKTNVSAFSIAISYVKHNSKILKRISNHNSCDYPLHQCIKEEVIEKEKIRALRFLLSNTRTLNKNTLNREKETLLITAAKICPDMVALFDFLVSLNIDVNAKDVLENTALDYLIESRNEFEFKKRKASICCLLSTNPTVHGEEKQDYSPMLRVMQFMMSKSYLYQTNPYIAPFQTIEHIRNKSQTKAFKKQNKEKHKDVFVDIEIVRRILDITTADLSNYFGENERTYLHYCTSTHFSGEHVLAICKRLVQLGVNIHMRDKDGLNCVDIALKYCGKDNYNTLVYLLDISDMQDFDVDKALQDLADGNNLYVQIIEYFKENIFVRKKTTKNILHYLASIRYDPKLKNKHEREELFSCLQSVFAVDEGNADGRIPLHVAIEKDSSVSTLLNFLRISEKCINKADSKGDTALHLVLNSEKPDDVVREIVTQMLKYEVDVNARNRFFRTPLMVAVKCLKDRSKTVACILKSRFVVDLCLKDRSGLTILHHCIEAPKDDITACSILSLFLNSGLPVPVNSNSESGLTPLNLAAKNVSYSRILCILRLLYVEDCLIETVDNEGRSPLYNTAACLQGTHPLINLERLIRSYIFLLHGDSPYIKTNDNDNVLDICGVSNFHILSDILKIGITERKQVYMKIKGAFYEVAGTMIEKNNKVNDELDKVNLWSIYFKKVMKMKTLISNCFPYLSNCTFDILTNEEVEKDCGSQSSVPDLEYDFEQ